MTRWDDFTSGGNYLKASDLQGREALVTIEKTVWERMEDRDKGHEIEKPVLYFVGKEKALVLNKTNCDHLNQLFGYSPDDSQPQFVGKQIVLFSVPTQLGEGIRLRAPQQSTQQQQPQNPPAGQQQYQQPTQQAGDDVPF